MRRSSWAALALGVASIAGACARGGPPARGPARFGIAHPEYVSGPPLPRLPPGGVAVIRCVITVEGAVTGCRVVRRVAPAFDAALLRAFERRRYRPALRAGTPVEMSYTFELRAEDP